MLAFAHGKFISLNKIIRPGAFSKRPPAPNALATNATKAGLTVLKCRSGILNIAVDVGNHLNLMTLRKNFMEPLFEEIAFEEGVDLKREYEKSFSKLITFSPMTDENEGLRTKLLELEIPYKEHMISIQYEVGDEQSGKWNCRFNDGLKMNDFAVGTISPYVRLIFKRRNILKVTSQDSNLKSYIEKKLVEIGLEEIARKSQFLPEIKGFYQNEYQIKTTYSLSFNDKQKVLRPMIKFYKELIDWATTRGTRFNGSQQRK